ncbi:MAG: DUF4412 domain-containing protein [Acidobacteria bacterium]|jgi:hypothetical protein|nr:DUF4412 domain-containing protein [Acidobacteriota bacterium]
MKAFRIAVLIVLAAALAAPAFADTLLTMKSHSDGGMGQPPSDETTTMWLAKDRLCLLSGDTAVIVRADQKKLYMIDTTSKTYSEFDLPLDILKYYPPDLQAQIGPQLAQLKYAAKLTPTAESKKIGAWNAKLYKAEITNPMGIRLDMDLWVSKDIAGIDVPSYKELAFTLQGFQPGFEEVTRALATIDGISVLTEKTVSIMGTTVKSREELVSVETKPAPAGIYEVPAGMTKEAYDPRKAVQKAAGK